ncbi:nuclear transport factor 2 family protein [Microdochium nivale]|nr:nuclear transport factor 2 family protein [Microdochium nivale]
MAALYDVQTFLLDKTNIHDTITQMMLGYDDHDMNRLRDKVFASNILMDYSALLGTEPTEYSREDWLQYLKRVTEGFDSTQHTAQDMLIELPQPTNGATRPKTVAVVAYVNAHMVRRDARGGPMMHNGGRTYFELEHSEKIEDAGENPWRISKMRVAPAWEEGNSAVLDVARK